MRARGAQALTVLVLSVLAVAGAVGAPWYILAAERSALLADIATAPADQRVVTASRVLRLSDTDPAAGLGAFRATVERSLSIPGVRPVLGLSGLADAVGQDGGGVRFPVTYREDVCAHLTLVGRCPTGKDEALLSRYTAELMAAGIGARIPVRPPALGRATLTGTGGRAVRTDGPGRAVLVRRSGDRRQRRGEPARRSGVHRARHVRGAARAGRAVGDLLRRADRRSAARHGPWRHPGPGRLRAAPDRDRADLRGQGTGRRGRPGRAGLRGSGRRRD